MVGFTDTERKILRAAYIEPFFTDDPAQNEAIASLKRFGYVTEKYDKDLRTYLYSPTPEQGAVLAEIIGLPERDFSKQCCKKATQINCVCLIKVGCVDHGDRCYGSHD